MNPHQTLQEWCQIHDEPELLNEFTGISVNHEQFSADKISCLNTEKLRWKCQKGHEWNASCQQRTRRHMQCPVCFPSRKRPYLSLRDWCIQQNEMEMLNEFSGFLDNGIPVSSSNISFSSAKKCKWICRNHHTWIQSCNYRVNFQRKCPVCNKKPLSKSLLTWAAENGEYGKRILSEFTGKKENGEDVSADQIPYGSSKKFLWRCEKGHEWVMTCNRRTIVPRNPSSGCPFCFPDRYRYKVSITFKEWCIAHQKQEMMTELPEGIDPSSIPFWDKTPVEWTCKNGHTWTDSCNNRTMAGGKKCPVCSSSKNSLRTWCMNHGDYGEILLEEFLGESADGKPVTPDEISYGSTKKCKWKKANGKICVASPNYKTKARFLKKKRNHTNG